MTYDVPQILVSVVLGTAVFLLIWSLFRFPVASTTPVHRRFAVAVGKGDRQTLFEQPFLAPLMNLSLVFARRFNLLSLRAYVRRQLDAAGNPAGYSVDEYLAISLFSFGVFCVTGAAVGFVVLDFIDPFTILFVGLIGFAVPIIALRERAQSRLMRVSKQLPYSLDLIALMMGAGSTFTEAVETIIRDSPEEDLNRELQIVLAEIEFGTRRSVALQNMADRIPIDSLRSIVAAVNQAESLGTPLSVILKSQSDILRMHRSVRAEKLSASASLRILVPTMLILVAVVLFVFGPIIVRWLRGDLLY